jgi:hypothetical protein
MIAGFLDEMLDDFYRKTVMLSEFNLEETVTEIINNNKEYLTDLLKDQLAKGMDADNERVRVFDHDYYSRETVLKKKDMDGLSGAIDRITNYMTGSFYAELDVNASDQQFTFSSNVPYFDEIIYQSGIRIVELSPDSIKRFRDEILVPQIQEYFELKINGL